MAKRRTPFPQAQIESLSDSDEDKEQKLEILERLCNQLQTTRPVLSQYEREWLFISILLNYEAYRHDPGHWEERLALLKHEQLADHRFIHLMQNCEYFKDINGHFKHQLLWFRAFSGEENQENVAFLRKVANEWEKTISLRNHTDQLLQRLSVEAEDVIGQELAPLKEAGYGANIRDTFRVQLLLLYKYIYVRGRMFFENLESYLIPIDEKMVVFDVESFVHLGRHIAPSVRPGLIGKSNFSQDFLLGNAAGKLADIFAKISGCPDVPGIELDSQLNTQLFFEYHRVVYSVWIQPVVQLGARGWRLASFYPSESRLEAEKRSALARTLIEDGLYYFQ